MAQQYLFLFRGGDPASAGVTPELVMQQWSDWIAALKAQGRFVHGEPLQGPIGGIVRSAGRFTAALPDSPERMVAGYMAVRAADMDQAQAIASGCPVLALGGAVEIRLIWVMNGS